MGNLRSGYANPNGAVFQIRQKRDIRTEVHSRKNSLGRKAIDFLKEIVGAPSTYEQVEVLQARAVDSRTGQIEWFDFLSDKFVFVCRVVKQQGRQRAVD